MGLDAEAWVEIARLYRETEVPVSEIATRFGIAVRRLHERRRAENWPLRSARGPSDATTGKINDETRTKPRTVKRSSRPVETKRRRSAATPATSRAKAKTAAAVSAPRPEAAKPEPTSASPRDRGGCTTVASRRALVRRLYRAIDVKLQRLEKRMTSGDEPSIADSERETRELSHMIRSFEKVTEVAADIAQHAANKHAVNKHLSKPPAGSARDGRKQPAGYVSADAERMRHEIAERLERLHRARAPGK